MPVPAAVSRMRSGWRTAQFFLQLCGDGGGVLADDFLPLPVALIPPDAVGPYAPFCLFDRVNLATAVFAKIDCAVDVRHPRSPRFEIPGERKKAKNPPKKLAPH